MLISGPLTQADEELFRFLNQAGANPLLDGIMVFFTILGFSYVMVLLAAPIWLRGKKELAFDFVVVIILATVLSEIVKAIVDRQRPLEVLSDVNTLLASGGPSFPSGHATRAFAMAVFIWLGFRWKAGVVATGVALLIGMSRVYLGVHWPSDVLTGAVLGAAVAIGIDRLAEASDCYRRLRARLTSRDGA
ncbi:MAG: phosphatase PAP2 family protein [Thermoplasmata archaeon]